MTALLSFIVLIVIVVSVHEFGHYWVARRLGVRVLRFSVGFGKPLWIRKDKNDTEWALAPIPLGGYVRLLDEQTARDSGLPLAATMEAQSNWRRILIYAAGPAANLVLTAVIMAFLLAGGETGFSPKIGGVRPASAAADAGLQEGDVIAAVNDAPAVMWRQVELALLDAAVGGDAATLALERGEVRVLPAGAAAVDDMRDGVAAAFGMIRYDGYLSPTLAVVANPSPAAAAGLRQGDVLVAIDDVVVERWSDALQAIHAKPEQRITLLLWRDDAAVTTTAALQAKTDGGGSRGYLGVAPTVDRETLQRHLVTVHYNPQQLLANAFSRTIGDVSRTFAFIALMLKGGASADNISGPVGIASQSGEAAERGLLAWLRFMALISASLAALNLLPLPLLDGGHIGIAVIQSIIRRDLPKRFLRVFESIGAALLFMLILWVIVKDSLLLWG